MKTNRNADGFKIQDPASIHNLEYNEAAGSKKVSEIGRHLLPIHYINAGVEAWTTDATTARVIDPGKSLAIYNNSASLGAITLGEDNTVVALAAGATDATGHVGIPCMPNAWTYVACNTQNWFKATAATLLVFVIDDSTTVRTEVK